jgi:hypothetical protein
MIGYVSGHVKARRKISMVQRGSCLAFAGIAWGLAGVRSRRMRGTLFERVLLPVSVGSFTGYESPRSFNLDGTSVQSMASCLDTLYHF